MPGHQWLRMWRGCSGLHYLQSWNDSRLTAETWSTLKVWQFSSEWFERIPIGYDRTTRKMSSWGSEKAGSWIKLEKHAKKKSVKKSQLFYGWPLKRDSQFRLRLVPQKPWSLTDLCRTSAVLRTALFSAFRSCAWNVQEPLCLSSVPQVF